MNRAARQNGMTLVEVLIAMVIGLFLLAGIVQVYLGNRVSFAFTNAIAETQENGRFALDIISQDLRSAGEWGCIQFDPDAPDNVNNTLTAATVPGFDLDFHDFTGRPPIEGEEGGGLNGSDSLTIRGGKPGQSNVETPFFTATSKKLRTRNTGRIEVGDIVLLARCGANDLLIDAEADVHRVAAIDATVGNDQRELSFASEKSQQFENDAVLIELQTVNYFIDAGASGQPALYRQEFGEQPQELVEGVEEMQILYGVDTDADQFPNQYQQANAVADFNEVVAAQIRLLMRSMDDNVTDNVSSYRFNGIVRIANDRHLRREFSATIALRNRIGS